MTSEQQLLLEKAKRSLTVAKRLLEDEDYEFSIPRAYYAMFYVAQAFLQGIGLTFSKHSAVISAFGKHFAKTGLIPTKFHTYLTKAQDERLIGDYDYHSVLTQEDAVRQIQRAEEFLNFAEQYFADNS